MSYHNIHFGFKKLKRGLLIWITLISLLINLWLDNTRFTIFQTKSSKKSRIQIKRAKWFTNQLIKLGSAFIKSEIRVIQISKPLFNFFKRK